MTKRDLIAELYRIAGLLTRDRDQDNTEAQPEDQELRTRRAVWRLATLKAQVSAEPIDNEVR